MPTAQTQSSSFRFFCPVEVFQKGDDKDPRSRRIRGFITTEHPDRENEIVLQKNLDFDQFLQHGWFNDNHKQDTASVLGYPVTVEKRKTADGRRGHWVEGYLLRGYEPADRVWNLAQALKASNAPRQLGFSVEGKIHQRGQQGDYSTVAKATVRNVAITPQPVNPNAGMDIFCKALTAGSAVNAPSVRPGEGFPLRTESLYGGPTALTPIANRKRRRMSESEALDFLINKGCKPGVAHSIVQLAKVL